MNAEDEAQLRGVIDFLLTREEDPVSPQEVALLALERYLETLERPLTPEAHPLGLQATLTDEGKGQVELSWGPYRVALAPDEAHALALSLVACAGAAETTAYLHHYFTQVIRNKDMGKKILDHLVPALHKQRQEAAAHRHGAREATP